MDSNQQNNSNKEPFSNPSKTRLFRGKANTDFTKELLGVNTEAYIDALNIRVNDSTSGVEFSASSIGGEELKHRSSLGQYECIGATNVGDRLVEFWAPQNPSDGGVIKIDGVVMCRSEKFAITPIRMLQWDTNADAIGGEIYITDFYLRPMMFSIKDIIDNFGVTNKYFSDFNINRHILSLVVPPDNMVYDEKPLVSVGTGGGLPNGQYAWSHRFASSSGDRTMWSVPTPLIFVPAKYQAPSYIYPFDGNKTVGGNPDPNTPGEYGVKLKFRVNNVNNYEFIEIKRTAYNGGEAIGFAPTSFIVKRIPLTLTQTSVSVYEYVDSVSNQSEELIIADDDSQNFISEIKRCRSIRYFFNKIILGNIEYESRDLTNEVSFKLSDNGNAMCPILEEIGREGYKNPYIFAYKKMYMHNESYGFYIVGWDSNYSRTLAIEVPGFAAFTMPSKRDVMTTYMSGDSIAYTKSINRQSTVSGTVDNTFEIVDYKSAETRKTDTSMLTQVMGKNILTGHAGVGNAQCIKNGTRAGAVGYRPYYPISPLDVRDTYRYSPTYMTSRVGLFDSGGGPLAPPPQDEPAIYNPAIFNPKYHALGMCMIGLDSWPDWMTAFSVVRTKKAGRVVAQGLAFYNMQDSTRWNEAGGGGYKRAGTKSKNKIVVQFPDIENGVLSSSIVDDIILNPTSFKLQMVEPLGFNSEIFHFRSCSLNNTSRPGGVGLPSSGHADTQVDMVVYPACQAELSAASSYGEKRVVGSDADNPASETGIPDASEPAGSTGFVSFGIWRNQPNGSPNVGGSPFVSNGNYKFSILSASKVFEEENVRKIEFELSEDIYLEAGNIDNPFTGDVGDFFADTTKNWQEPVYICNLIREGATVQNLDIQPLLPTGTYIKIRSVIGYGNGLPGQSLSLCGERNEDVGKYGSGAPDAYLWVEMNSDGEFFRWINIDYLSPIDIATIQNDIDNGTTNYNGKRLYGTYSCNGANSYTVTFGSTYIPPINATIEVRYDNSKPVYVFGGDTTVGQAAFPVIHRSTGTSNGTGDQPGDGNTYGSMLKLQRGMPYLWYKLRSNYYILRNSNRALLPVIQACDTLQASTAGTDWCKISAIRQLVAIYNCQTYTCLPLSYQESYPCVNYVMRPTKWDDSKTPSDQNINSQYEADYPDEHNRWQLGGIRIKQFEPAILNLDYSKENIVDRYSKVSNILFLEKTWFPTRIQWSYTRPIQNILAPNLKSFSPFNVFDLSDNRGQIQRLYVFKHGNENLFAACEDDWCEVLTRKRTLTDLGGNALGVTGNGADVGFIQEQIWLNEIKKGALRGEFWKTFADNGDEGFYANQNGVFKITGAGNSTQIVEIGDGYFYQIYKSFCSRVNRSDIILLSQNLYGVYDTKNEEYWLRFKTDTQQFIAGGTPLAPTTITMFDEIDGVRIPHAVVSKSSPGGSINLIPIANIDIDVVYKFIDSTGSGVPVYANGTNIFAAQNGEWWRVKYNSLSGTFSFRKIEKDLNELRDSFIFAYSNRGEQSGWLGVFDYDFNMFCSFDSKTYGFRNENPYQSAYSLDKGLKISGSGIDVKILTTINPELQQSYVFQRMRINSNIRPNVKFYNTHVLDTSIATLQSTDLKNYHAFENHIPREVSGDNSRVSNTHVVLQFLTKLTDKQFFINSFTTFYNKIK